ncbi:MAG TPA: hypothetical protein VGX78_02525 [Pirellulales bacterium]|nr:hypothetical protein [Pirellulales bacterium]
MPPASPTAVGTTGPEGPRNCTLCAVTVAEFIAFEKPISTFCGPASTLVPSAGNVLTIAGVCVSGDVWANGKYSGEPTKPPIKLSLVTPSANWLTQ